MNYTIISNLSDEAIIIANNKTIGRFQLINNISTLIEILNKIAIDAAYLVAR